MQAGIVAKTPALSAALRAVLDGFHSQKVHAAVDALLLRLYEPLLFRGLGAANAAVRRNSILLLFDAFPLQVSAVLKFVPPMGTTRSSLGRAL